MDVVPIPGLEHLPFAEAWFTEVDEALWREASERARALGKSGLDAWTTTRTPAVAAFFAERGYDEQRRYVISELEVARAPDLGPPAWPLVTFADRPDLARAMYDVALVAHGDQPGRDGTSFSFESWQEWGLHAHPPEAHLIVLDGEQVAAYGYLQEKDASTWVHGFTAVARPWRGRGLAGAIKRAQVAYARERGIERLETATEVRLAGMRALNARFGYVPQYEEIVLRGPLG